jgi:hypothetical protein
MVGRWVVWAVLVVRAYLTNKALPNAALAAAAALTRARVEAPAGQSRPNPYDAAGSLQQSLRKPSAIIVIVNAVLLVECANVVVSTTATTTATLRSWYWQATTTDSYAAYAQNAL